MAKQCLSLFGVHCRPIHWDGLWNCLLQANAEICNEEAYTSALSSATKIQALVYDILPSTTAIFSYAIGSRKLSANEQCFVRAQTIVSLLQTIQIISDICFITGHVAYASSNKRKWFESKWNSFFFLFFLFLFSFFFYPGWMRLMFTCVLGC